MRYTTPERINHWVIAFCFVLAAVSGLGFFFPSLNWLMHVLGTPQLVHILHPFIGVVMLAPFIIMFSCYWHHNLINRDDIFWVKNIRKIVVNEEVGDTGCYNFDQKCVFWAAVILLVLLLVSSVIVWCPCFVPAFLIPVTRFALMLHSFATVVLIMVIMVHIHAVLWVKGTITAMVEGWITKTWAKRHHPRRYREARQKQEKSSEWVFA